ncbi:hypothetical protein DERP_004069 [Dermatophagoides pteronyssinus]|uniref:Uncharacterized protein n=1 Tax=Dermatophagoides pteronyssinus TaxID=6956 RepID=A0ABQ8J867_DERPT|nr:hypothetical protein DERP_004069 [Dermatophagoides pteronyssinus]
MDVFIFKNKKFELILPIRIEWIDNKFRIEWYIGQCITNNSGRRSIGFFEEVVVADAFVVNNDLSGVDCTGLLPFVAEICTTGAILC